MLVWPGPAREQPRCVRVTQVVDRTCNSQSAAASAGSHRFVRYQFRPNSATVRRVRPLGPYAKVPVGHGAVPGGPTLTSPKPRRVTANGEVNRAHQRPSSDSPEWIGRAPLLSALRVPTTASMLVRRRARIRG